ncbi:MAG: hypothetical protein WCJ58_00845 [bacterium]
MTKEKLPKVINSGEIKLGDIVLKVHNLDDGRRIIEEESIEKFFEYLTIANAKEPSEEELINLGKFIKNL